MRAEGEKLYNEGKEKDALKILREAKNYYLVLNPLGNMSIEKRAARPYFFI
jgi:hypothetical protein